MPTPRVNQKRRRAPIHPPTTRAHDAPHPAASRRPRKTHRAAQSPPSRASRRRARSRQTNRPTAKGRPNDIQAIGCRRHGRATIFYIVCPYKTTSTGRAPMVFARVTRRRAASFASDCDEAVSRARGVTRRADRDTRGWCLATRGSRRLI